MGVMAPSLTGLFVGLNYSVQEFGKQNKLIFKQYIRLYFQIIGSIGFYPPNTFSGEVPVNLKQCVQLLIWKMNFFKEIYH